MTLTLSDNDRIEAIRRCPEYKKDLARKKDFTPVGFSFYFFCRWGVLPELIEQKPTDKIIEDIPFVERPIRLSDLPNKEMPLIQPFARLFSIIFSKLVGEPPREEEIESLIKSIENLSSELTEDKFRLLTEWWRYLKNDGSSIYLHIDPQETKEGILKEVARIIDNEQKRKMPKKKSRKGETIDDPWEVYDKHHEEGLPLLQIAQEKYKFKGNPSHYETAKKYYERIIYAYNKTKRMIDAVKPKKPF